MDGQQKVTGTAAGSSPQNVGTEPARTLKDRGADAILNHDGAQRDQCHRREHADRFRMIAVITAVASEGARQTLEKMMKTKEFEKTFIERIHDDGIAEGEARGEAKALLRILDARGIALTAEQRAQITGCTDAAQLDRWLDRAATATAAAEVLAA